MVPLWRTDVVEKVSMASSTARVPARKLPIALKLLLKNILILVISRDN